MTVLTPVRLHRSFSEVVEREARAVCAQGDEAGEELDTFIEAEAHQPETIRRLWNKVWDRKQPATVHNIDGIEAEFRRLFDAALASLNFLREWAEQFQARTGQRTKNADLLERTWQAVTELHTKVAADLAWLTAPPPELTGAQYEEAMADVRNGEGVDVEDIIRELQGDIPPDGSETDR